MAVAALLNKRWRVCLQCYEEGDDFQEDSAGVWRDVVNTHVFFKGKSADESVASDQIEGRITFEVMMREYKGHRINSSMRMVRPETGRIYNIAGAYPFDVRERWLIVKVVEVDGGCNCGSQGCCLCNGRSGA